MSKKRKLWYKWTMWLIKKEHRRSVELWCCAIGLLLFVVSLILLAQSGCKDYVLELYVFAGLCGLIWTNNRLVKWTHNRVCKYNKYKRKYVFYEETFTQSGWDKVDEGI